MSNLYFEFIQQIDNNIFGSLAGKLLPVPRDVREVQKQADKEKKKASKIAAKAATKGTKRRFQEI